MIGAILSVAMHYAPEAIGGAALYTGAAGMFRGIGTHFGWWKDSTQSHATAWSAFFPGVILVTGLMAGYEVVTRVPKYVFDAGDKTAAKLASIATGKPNALRAERGMYYETKAALVEEPRKHQPSGIPRPGWHDDGYY